MNTQNITTRVIKQVAVFGAFFALLCVVAGCAGTSQEVISSPEIQTASNPFSEIKFEPRRFESTLFNVFYLEVVNKTSGELEIDWNKTRYLYKGKPYGVFVFKDIDPKTIKESIPPDLIAQGETFTKVIFPLKLIARASRREQSKRSLYPGPIPLGENGISLVIRSKGKEIREKIVINLEEVEPEQK